jgi:hypothetical protein
MDVLSVKVVYNMVVTVLGSVFTLFGLIKVVHMEELGPVVVLNSIGGLVLRLDIFTFIILSLLSLISLLGH